jgi:Protein of unknown function (DUF3105)
MRRNMCFAACAGRLFSLRIVAWSLAVVLSSIAPAFGQVPPLPELMLSLNQTEFRSGDTFHVGLGARNPGPALTADFVFGFFPPDGATACFITDLAPLSVQCLDLTAGPLLVLPPLATRIEVPEGLDGMLHDLFDVFVYTFSGEEASGQYAVFAILTQPDTANILAIARAPFLWDPELPFGSEPVPAGVQSFAVTERLHVEGPVSYPQTPPVGGNHAPIWQNCGFYDTPIPNESAVHSLEHSAVWITYQPDLPDEEVDALRQLAHRQPYVLVSPFPDLPAPIVASAWGYQVALESSDDPRLSEFVRAFRLGSQAPERGAPCTRGIGAPIEEALQVPIGFRGLEAEDSASLNDPTRGNVR